MPRGTYPGKWSGALAGRLVHVGRSHSPAARSRPARPGRGPHAGRRHAGRPTPRGRARLPCRPGRDERHSLRPG